MMNDLHWKTKSTKTVLNGIEMREMEMENIVM